MADPNFRVQLTRGTTSQVDQYVGREGELVIDMEQKTLRAMDGVTPGGSYSIGSGTDVMEIQVVDFSSGNFVLPEGVTVTKEYSDSSLRIEHNKGKVPVQWFGINKTNTGSPAVGIYPNATTNIQIVDNNTIIITNISGYNVAGYNLIF